MTMNLCKKKKTRSHRSVKSLIEIMQISVSPQDKLTAFNCRYLNFVLVSGETRLLVTVLVCLQVLTTYHKKTCLADMKKTCILLKKLELVTCVCSANALDTEELYRF